MTKFEDNPSPYTTFVEQSSKSGSAPSGDQWIYFKTDHKFYHKDSSGTETEIGSSSSNHAYFNYLAALLEPLAVDPLKKGAFSYSVGSGSTVYCIASWQTQLDTAGRLEVRLPQVPLALRGVTMTGTGTYSTAAILNPNLCTYTNAYTTYHDRLKTIADTSNRYLAAPGTTEFTFLPGPYGSILTRVVNFESVGLISLYNGLYGLNYDNEISDVVTQRGDSILLFPASKNIINEFKLWNAAGGAAGGIVYFICPSSWSVIVDPTTYAFRDDFMGSSLDTATIWTRAQSSAGNVEIDTNFQWLHLTGNTNWGQNGCYTQTFSQSRSAGKVLVMDIHLTRVTGGPATPAGMFGWSDGGGHSYTNFSHGFLFNGDGTLKVYENGNDRGVVGSGITIGNLYRIRITLDSAGANSAKYEIQGGTQYTDFGGTTWTNVTPGTTSSSTTPVKPGLSIYQGQIYAGDVKVY